MLDWEDEARRNGLELYGTPEALKRREGFTIVYGFAQSRVVATKMSCRSGRPAPARTIAFAG